MNKSPLVGVLNNIHVLFIWGVRSERFHSSYIIELSLNLHGEMVRSQIENNSGFMEEKIKISDFPSVTLLKEAIEKSIKNHINNGWFFVALENCGKYIYVKFRLDKFI